ncbi:hypothetical protein OMO38_15880 [Chryseobacterium sp. 09-1422]|uniref:DUF1700 domain-containing protein n=1 Tax=Chryseobacterium kimseyorum TaxID=2984028 RepID=A0ABT3I1X8_9FLAO|nr:hypothetical protein [Chryseobacterium kimseyorum]MCW3170004.1 hypothetical protein [Chryseobacterium kimseyorum]
MKNFYKNFNEEDLIAAYLYMKEHTGEINEEMTEAINQKFNYNDFISKADNKTLLVKEKGRISYEIYQLVVQGSDLDSVFENISSTVLNNQELENFIILKFNEFSSVKVNRNIDRDTIFKSILGVFISSVIGLLFFLTTILITGVFSFFLLVPLYIINYFLIRQITGKTRDNLIVFLAVFISVIISTLLPFVFFT